MNARRPYRADLVAARREKPQAQGLPEVTRRPPPRHWRPRARIARHVRCAVAAVEAFDRAGAWRAAVRTQSIAVSPPMTTTFLPSASSAPGSKAGTASPRPLRFKLAVRKSSAATMLAGPTRAPGVRALDRRGRDQQRVVLLQILERRVADRKIRLEGDAWPAASSLTRRSTTSFSSRIWDAGCRDQEPAGPVVPIVDRDLVARAASSRPPPIRRPRRR